MDSLIRFGLGSTESYDFVPARQAEYQDNFADIMQQSVRVPGKDGGLSPFGLGRGPAEVGNVRVSFWVHGGSMAETGHLVSLVKSMAYWGVRRLFKRHQNGELMWTWASVSSVQVPQVVRRMPHLRQQVQMTFQCLESKWYSAQGMLFFNDDDTFGDGLVFPPLKVDQEAVSDGSTVTVINRGNVPVSAYVRWDGNGTDSFTNPVITRKNWLDETVNQLTYTGTIGANDVIEIDARSLTTTTRSALTVLSGDWLTIPAGSWDLEISGTFTTTGLLTVDFWDGWV
jgi:hypothetical protein